MEKNYEFRKRMLEIHRKNIRDLSIAKSSDEFEIKDGFSIFVSENAGDVIITAARDFIDYLFTSMNISAILKKGECDRADNAMVIALAEETGADLGDCAQYRGYRIDTTETAVYINGYDERGAAQALYSLERIMNIKKAPYLPIGTVARKPMFSPQMVHSGYGLDEYPNEHLNAIAHEGRDAILVFTNDVNVTPYGYLDFNELIYRAKKYGIDVYAYSYLKSEKHPDDEGAEAYYENTYGKLFRLCPELKGVTLVGESVEFPSKDPHVSGRSRFDNNIDGIPTGKTSPGWYPCCDYPQWLELVKKIIRKYNSEADIVFWTYNWSKQSEEARVKLIESLPQDITLLTNGNGETFERDGIAVSIDDYSLAYPNGCDCEHFKSEAAAAKRRGIKLYMMSNTGGLTWDIGVIPYEPFPYQWIKRYKSMEQAHKEYNLCGIMESHHYGFYPSFISELSNVAFFEGCDHIEERLLDILAGRYGKENADSVNEALKLWSEAIDYYIPSNGDQYGPFRIGPSYPLNIEVANVPPAMPYAHFGNGIVKPIYYTRNILGIHTAWGEKIHYDIKWLTKMHELMLEGLEILKKIENKNDELLRLINMGEFIANTVTTGIHVKKWHILTHALKYESTKDALNKVVDDMEKIVYAEMENVKNTIPLVNYDSRLGWEPSMEYMTDEYRLKWKLRQLEYILTFELKEDRDCINRTEGELKK